MPSGPGDFAPLKTLGSGVSGVVRLARRRADGRLYAVKEMELPSDPGAAAAILQETHILAAIEHPYVIRYYDSFLEHRRLYVVMEYAVHGSLHGLLQQHQRLGVHIEEELVWRFCIQLLAGLHAIHSRRATESHPASQVSSRLSST